MPRNNSIHFLRGNSNTVATSDATLDVGQPLYITDKNYLTVGGGANTKSVHAAPIVVREVIGYQGDTSDTIGNNTAEVYSIRGNGTSIQITAAAYTNISSPGGVNLNSTSGGTVGVNTGYFNVNAYGCVSINAQHSNISVAAPAGNIDFNVARNYSVECCIISLHSQSDFNMVAGCVAYTLRRNGAGGNIATEAFVNSAVANAGGGGGGSSISVTNNPDGTVNLVISG